MLNPVGAGGALRRRDVGAPCAGQFVKDADPALIDALAAAGQARDASSTTRTRTRTAGAAARRSSTGRSPRGSRARRRTRTTLLRENETHRLAPRAHQARALRRLAREQRRLGALARPLLGHAAPGVALRRLRHRHLRRLGRRARRARRAATSPTSTCTGPYVDDVTIDCPKCERPGARRVEPVLDAWFDSGVDAGGAVPLPVRERRRSSSAASPPTSSARRSTRRAAGSTRCSRSTRSCSAAVAVPQRRLPRAASSTRTARRCRSRRATSSTRGRCSTRAAPTRCAGTSSPSGSPWTPRAGVGRGASTSRRAGSCVTLWNTYSFFVTYANLDGWEPGRGAAARRRRTCSTAGSGRGCTRTVARGHRRARGLRRAARRAGARALRRRPLELVRAPLAAALLEGGRPGRARDAARVPLDASRCCSRRSRPFVADELYRNLAGTDESVHLADWPVADAGARSTRRSKPRWSGRARSCRSGSSARNEAKLKVRQPLRRALVLLPDGATFSDDGRRRDRRRAQREAARGGHRPRRPARLHGRPELPRARPEGRQADAAGEGRARRRPTAPTCSARSTRDGALRPRRSPTARPCALEPDDVEVRAESHEELALAQDGGYAVALDTTLDDELRAEGIARELIRAAQRPAQGRRASRSPTASACASAPTGRVEAAAHAHRDWIAREVLAVEFDVRRGARSPTARRASRSTATRCRSELTRVER